MLDLLAGGAAGSVAVQRRSRRPAIRPCGCSAASAWPIRRASTTTARTAGYAALRRAVELGPEGVLREVEGLEAAWAAAARRSRRASSGRRSRASPPGRTTSCATPTSPSPGTFKDRELLEGDPFAVIEAMTIAAYATGCERGYVYLRGEYPRGPSRLEHALDGGARAAASSGDDVMGEGFAFDIEVRVGAGAYICGEETAIFNSIEGKRGEPRNKPPFPVEVGLFGKPTVVNNVETLVNVLDVVLGCGPAFAETGTERLDRHEALLRLRARRAAGVVRGAASARRCARCSTWQAASPAGGGSRPC